MLKQRGRIKTGESISLRLMGGSPVLGLSVSAIENVAKSRFSMSQWLRNRLGLNGTMSNLFIGCAQFERNNGDRHKRMRLLLPPGLHQ